LKHEKKRFQKSNLFEYPLQFFPKPDLLDMQTFPILGFGLFIFY